MTTTTRKYMREYMSQWRRDNPDKERAIKARYRAGHPEIYAAGQRRSYLRHREERLEKIRVYHMNNARLSVDDYNKLLKIQGGKCAICRQPPRGRRLAIDHNHQNEAVRGLLCSRCNTVLGLLEEDVGRLQEMINYLDNHNGKIKGVAKHR